MFYARASRRWKKIKRRIKLVRIRIMSYLLPFRWEMGKILEKKLGDEFPKIASGSLVKKHFPTWKPGKVMPRQMLLWVYDIYRKRRAQNGK